MTIWLFKYSSKNKDFYQHSSTQCCMHTLLFFFFFIVYNISQ